ncbi:MAG: tetratricopeptide repeat protein [Gammaproteobacteria bacterium]|nr:tetratricopeptide repeat protein [Gammaproteobacteria bacterium]
MRINTVFRLLLALVLGIAIVKAIPVFTAYYYAFFGAQELLEAIKASATQMNERISFQNRMLPGAVPAPETALEIPQTSAVSEAVLAYRGLNHMQNKEYEKAKQVYRELLERYTQQAEPDNRVVLDVLYNLAEIQVRSGKPNQAGDYYRRAIVLEEKLFGANNPRSAVTRRQLEELPP